MLAQLEQEQQDCMIDTSNISLKKVSLDIRIYRLGQIRRTNLKMKIHDTRSKKSGNKHRVPTDIWSSNITCSFLLSKLFSYSDTSEKQHV